MSRRVLAVYRHLNESEPYAAAARAAGLDLVRVSADDPASLEGMDGLMLLGGSDVEPALFGEARHPETQEPDRARDALECSLIAAAVARDLPVFGICRGLQILNVQQGGTLVQHLDGNRHRTITPDKSLPAHEVKIVPNTLLASIEHEAASLRVNSRHHQSIARLADSLKSCAFDPRDGAIEAVERPGSRFVLAVQWHPENQAPIYPEQARLFAAFAAACDQSA